VSYELGVAQLVVRPLVYISMTTTTHLAVFAQAMKRFLASSLLFIAFTSLTGCSTTHRQPTVEYKQIFHSGKTQGPIEPVLNALAKEGWRAVGYQGFPEQEVWVLLERKK
jgi:hypothetical protein